MPMSPIQVFASCLMLAAQTYQVPPQVMVGILHVEGGRVGQAVGPNQNGTYDLGPMQVNTRWLPQLSRFWGVNEKTAHGWVKDNACVNLHVAAWILRQKLDDAGGNLFNGIARYHSATPQHGTPYAYKVIRAMDRQGLIDYGAARPRKQASPAAQKNIRVAER